MTDENHNQFARLDELTNSIREQKVSSSDVERVKAKIVAATSNRTRTSSQNFTATRGWIVLASLSACVVLMFSLFGPGRADAFAQMQQKLADFKTIQVSKASFMKDETEPYHSAKYLIQEPLLFRMEEKGIRTRTNIVDVANFESMSIWPEVEQCVFYPIYDTEGFLRTRNEFLDLLRFTNAKDAKLIGKQTVNGKDVIEYEIEVFRSIDEETSIASVFISPKTNLPVKLIERSIDGQYTVFENFVFDEFIDPALFEMEPPEGYKVKRVVAVDDTNLLLDPELGLGGAEFGMSQEEVTEALGQCSVIARFGHWSGVEPAIDEPKTELFYERGFRVAVCPENGAFQFTCGNLKEARPFQGLTSKGIRLGATRGSVEEAYGTDYKTPDEQSLSYQTQTDTTLLFRFKENVLDEIILTRQLTQ